MVFQDVFCSMMFMYIPCTFRTLQRRRYLNDRIWTIWTNGRSGSEPLTMRKASEVDMMNKYITYDITCDINRYQQIINRYQVSRASFEESNRKLNRNPTGIVWFDEFDIIWSFDDKPMLRVAALRSVPRVSAPWLRMLQHPRCGVPAQGLYSRHFVWFWWLRFHLFFYHIERSLEIIRDLPSSNLT